ncbi:uncharacterized protein LOC126614362 isoform X2 [Malus sylvestris]|uniref:uncharacterized protein LOC126614362 isoform X2 n=1 Tax=Malus sylvestris TaxID=3752 RepID=UPI0021ACA9BD|nr:uncharacterized protein LOC126614362 isoform X2 [Malus sylvestris]
MATHFFSRSIPKSQAMASFLSRSLSTATSATSLSTAAQSRSSSLSLLHRLRPLAGVMASAGRLSPAIARCLSTRSTTSSLRDPNPNWSNRPPKETILLDGCDFEHWLVVMEAPQGDITRDEIINSYIKTLATVVGSEEEARMKIYSVSTRCYYAFGALVSEEVSLKIKELPGVRWVLPDSYLDVKNKDYGDLGTLKGEGKICRIVIFRIRVHLLCLIKLGQIRDLDLPTWVLHPPTGVQCLPTWVLHPPTGLQCSLPTWVLHPRTGLQCRLPTWVHQTTTIIPSQATTGILGHRTAIIRRLPTATIRCRPTTTIRCLPITWEGCHQTTWLHLLMQDGMILDNTRITTRQTGMLESILVQTVTKLEASCGMMSLVGML